MKWNLDNPLFTKILAVVVAIGMFLFVSSESNRVNNNQATSHTITEVLTNIAVTSNVDEEKYYVSGIPDSASIRLDGPQPLIAQTAITQNFIITTPDLNELGPGEHQIELVAEGISDEISYNISPSSTTVRVEERKTENFEISLEFDDENYIADGYELADISASHQTATISGAESTINEIAEVKAIVQPNTTNITSDISTVGNIVVLNSSGEPLNVSIDPTRVEVQIDVESQETELPIELVEAGRPPRGYEFEISLVSGQPDTIKVSGDHDIISEMDNFEVEVDLSGVTESTRRTVPIVLPDGINEADLNELLVRIDVSEEDNQVE